MLTSEKRSVMKRRRNTLPWKLANKFKSKKSDVIGSGYTYLCFCRFSELKHIALMSWIVSCVMNSWLVYTWSRWNYRDTEMYASYFPHFIVFVRGEIALFMNDSCAISIDVRFYSIYVWTRKLSPPCGTPGEKTDQPNHTEAADV